MGPNLVLFSGLEESETELSEKKCTDMIASRYGLLTDWAITDELVFN